MRADTSTRFVLAAIDKILFNGELAKQVMMFDDQIGMIQIAKKDKHGNVMFDQKTGEIFTEVLHGKVEVTLNTGWSWENNAFRIDVMRSSTNWKREQ